MATIETRPTESPSECVVEMPLGLLGFERCKRFTLFSHPEEEPFLRLQAYGDSKPAFLVLSPFVVQPAYQPNIAEDDLRFLGLQDPNDSLLVSIVTMHGSQRATVNLKGPILLNRRTLVAKQVIPLNAADLPVAYPLPLQVG